MEDSRSLIETASAHNQVVLPCIVVIYVMPSNHALWVRIVVAVVVVIITIILDVNLFGFRDWNTKYDSDGPTTRMTKKESSDVLVVRQNDDGAVLGTDGQSSAPHSGLDRRMMDPPPLPLQNEECAELCHDIMMMQALPRADFSNARRFALTARNQWPHCEKDVAAAYVHYANHVLQQQQQALNDTPILVENGTHDDGQPAKTLLFHNNNNNNNNTGKSSIDCWTPGRHENPIDGDDQSGAVDLEAASRMVLERWDACCSQLVVESLSTAGTAGTNNNNNNMFQGDSSSTTTNEPELCSHVDPTTQRRQEFCCSFFRGSLSHLRLPLLQEISLNLVLFETASAPHANATSSATTTTTTTTTATTTHQFDLQLEQDGFLRKFDTAAVLWPTGYLLSLCLANPHDCGIERELVEAARSVVTDHNNNSNSNNSNNTVVAIELGAGIGAPSIVLSRFLQRRRREQQRGNNVSDDGGLILATDRALHALALTKDNAKRANVPLLLAHVEDHTNLTRLDQVKEQTNQSNGYAIVLGSSLQGLFDFQTQQPQHMLWRVLDNLLDRNNPHAIAVLAHVDGAVVPPTQQQLGTMFECVKRIPGNHFEMQTRSGDDSDFVISLYRRRRAVESIPLEEVETSPTEREL